MFPLIETAIGFLAVMLLLSLLVKSLTSLIKDHFDFYTDNVKYEASRFVRNALGKTWSELEQDPVISAKAPWVRDIKWERVGDEFFNKDNVEWMLKELGASPAQLQNLDGRLAVHLGRVKYMFEQRMKNLSVAVGLGLCLFLDINAIAIWRTLYTHDQLRTTFASEVATRALLESEKAEAKPSDNKQTAGALPSRDDAQREQQRQRLKEASDGFRKSLTDFTKEVSFGVGHIWKDPVDRKRDMLLEFLAACLTGILVSVGAPYWHDLLESLSSLRQTKK